MMNVNAWPAPADSTTTSQGGHFQMASSPRATSARSLAGNPDSPQAVVFLTSIID